MPAGSPRNLLIYAPVLDARMLNQGFYAAEAEGLSAHPDVAQVRLTNRLSEVARGDFDGLISYFYSYGALACILARLRGLPVIATGGAEQIFPAFAGGGWRGRALMGAFRLTALFAKRILATSTSDLAQMRNVVWLGRNKLELSFHGAAAVDRPVAAGPSDRPPGSFITICGMDTRPNIIRKGVPEALEVLSKASIECASAYLTILGRTTCQAYVEELARGLGVADRLHFAGYVTEEQKFALLQSHRYYLQLSVYEGFGIGALEALAQGCQVIHSGAGGLTDTIADFGVMLSREEIDGFSLAALPAYAGMSDRLLVRHLSAFRPAARADAILRALFSGVSAVPADADTLPGG